MDKPDWRNNPEVVEESISSAERLGYRTPPRDADLCPNPKCNHSWHGLPKSVFNQGECPGSFLFNSDV